jgi:adenosylhomocysteinase
MQASINETPGRFTALSDHLVGVAEGAIAGACRLRELAKTGELLYPGIDVNGSVTMSKFDGLYGSRHSLADGILRATDVMLAGKHAVVCGYGDVGKGSAASLRAQGARVTVTEIDPICALQACMAGYEVSTLESVLESGDVFITATGNKDVISAEQMEKMKGYAIVGNIGHFDNEIDVTGLNRIAVRTNIKPQVDRWRFKDGHAIILLSGGRLLNLGNTTGHPSFVASIILTNYALAQIELWTKQNAYGKDVYELSRELDEEVARLHLAALDAQLTVLRPDQAAYIGVPVAGPYKMDQYRY